MKIVRKRKTTIIVVFRNSCRAEPRGARSSDDEGHGPARGKTADNEAESDKRSGRPLITTITLYSLKRVLFTV